MKAKRKDFEKDILSKTKTLREFIDAYEEHHKHVIWCDPFGLVEQTEKKMLKELQELLKRTKILTNCRDL